MSEHKKHRIFSIAFILMFINLSLYVNISTVMGQPDTEKKSVESHYLIGANDIINIFVWKEPGLTQDISVMSDGRISFPMIGEIMAKGKTVSELKEIITEKLKDYVTDPLVTVMLRESRSRPIYIIGKVNHPGTYPLLSDITILQALSIAAGFTEWADTKHIVVVRREGRKDVMHDFNYQDFISGKNLSQNILLEPNDTIVVP